MKGRDAYVIGQKFENPANGNQWLIYFTQYDHDRKEWRYNMIKAGSATPIVLGLGNTDKDLLYHSTLKDKVLKRKLKLI